MARSAPAFGRPSTSSHAAVAVGIGAAAVVSASAISGATDSHTASQQSQGFNATMRRTARTARTARPAITIFGDRPLSNRRAELCAGASQSLLGLLGHGANFGATGELHHDHRVEEAHDDTTGRFLAHDDVAGQQRADLSSACKARCASGGLQAPRMR